MTSARYSYTAVTPSDKPSSPTLKRPLSSISADTASSDIFKSEPIHDRQSTFTGFFSPTLPPRDLQSHPSIASASHKILAWRIPASAPESSTKKVRQQSTLPGSKAPLQTGKDDDGEQHGAKHLARVLESQNLTGSLVVARWYGGVMLGPVRFAHMERAGREAVDKWRRATAGKQEEERNKELDEQERRELVQELERRDESIISLRGLLEEKKRFLSGLEGKTGGDDSSQTSPARKIDYGSLSRDRLRMLDKARDGTIGFLLKQIDGVESDIRNWEDLFDAKSGEDEQ